MDQSTNDYSNHKITMSEENKSEPPLEKPPENTGSYLSQVDTRIEMKLIEAKQSLIRENDKRLEEIAREKYEPRILRWQKISAGAFAVLIFSLLWGWFSLPDKIKTQADKIVDEKLVDPQITKTLDEALNKKAIPLINAKIQPIETNLAMMAANITTQKMILGQMLLDTSNQQAVLAAGQRELWAQMQPISNQIVSLKTNVDQQLSKVTALIAEHESLLFPISIIDPPSATKRLSAFAGTDIEILYSKDKDSSYLSANVMASLLSEAKWHTANRWSTNLEFVDWTQVSINIPRGNPDPKKLVQTRAAVIALEKELLTSGIPTIFDHFVWPSDTNKQPYQIILRAPIKNGLGPDRVKRRWFFTNEINNPLTFPSTNEPAHQAVGDIL
jgi:hypothetical protein